jgi:polyhydroxybutyrate depolymerase
MVIWSGVCAGALLACSSTSTSGDDNGTEEGSGSSDGANDSSDDGSPDGTGGGGSDTGGGDDGGDGGDTSTPGDTGEETGSSDTGEPVDCPVEDDLGAGDHPITLSHDGSDRTYEIHVPPAYDPEAATPVIVNMHGYTSAGWQQVLFSDMNPVADAEGFIVIYPDGIANSWNAGSCCGDAASTDVDDVGFLSAVIEDLSTKLCIDRARVYATGMSNGGYMSHRLACEASDVFAAVAPVAGAMGIPDCDPPRPMPVVAYHGTEDGLVDYADGAAAIDEWVGLNGCTGDPVRTDHGGSYCDRWESCDDGVEVELCTLDPMGHCWPGGSSTLCLPGIGPFNDDINANEHMWAFMSRFTLP